jgi:hypothetical protein
VNKDVKEKWLKALRSGEYKQGRERLKQDGDKFCCLGVLCDLHSKESNVKWKDDSISSYLENICSLPIDVYNWAGISVTNRSEHIADLMDMNDRGDSFESIANRIEEVFNET